MTGDYVVTSLAIPESLNLLHALLEKVAGEHPEIARDDLSMFETAVIEIAGNVVEHGRPNGQVIYTFSLIVEHERLVGRLADSGEAFPAQAIGSTAPDPDIDPTAFWSEDGRGLFLAQATLDELRYERTEIGNVWHMIRVRR